MSIRPLLLALAFVILIPETSRPEEFYDAMSALYEKQLSAEIEKECRNELRKNNRSLDAYYFLTAVLLDKASHAEAAYYAEKFKKHHVEREKELSAKEGTPVDLADPRYARVYREIGKQHFLNKEYQGAVRWLLKAKSGYYNDVMLNFFLGMSYHERQEYDEALTYLKRMLKNQPNEPVAYYSIARIYANKGAAADAAPWLRKAIELVPEFRKAAQKDKLFDRIRKSKEFVDAVNRR